MPQRANVGDVLMVPTADGRAAYIHYVGRHHEYGDGVAVCPGLRDRNLAIVPTLFENSYVTFFPAVAAVARGLASVVGHLPSSGLPTRFRRPGARSAGRVDSWVIENGRDEVVRRALSDDERLLPIAAIWNIGLLLQRVANEWRPETEGDSG